MSKIGQLATAAETKVAINGVFKDAAMNKAVHLELGKKIIVKTWIVICPEAYTHCIKNTLEEALHAKKMAEDAGHKANDPLEFEHEEPVLNYMEDLNACFQMEESLKKEDRLWRAFGMELEVMLTPDPGSNGGIDSKGCADIAHATPPQRVKAFLAAVKKTEPENATAAE